MLFRDFMMVLQTVFNFATDLVLHIRLHFLGLWEYHMSSTFSFYLVLNLWSPDDNLNKAEEIIATDC